MSSLRTFFICLAFWSAAIDVVPAQAAPPSDPVIRENAAVKVSDHVRVIPDFNVGLVPNVGIVVGSRGTLVVDTGLGPRNGQTVVREMNKVTTHKEIYVVSTHFHPEHALGESAFPATARLIFGPPSCLFGKALDTGVTT